MPGITSLAKKLFSKVSEARTGVSLIDLHQATDTPVGASEPGRNRILHLQYFPETLSDTKAVNWTQKEIPGGSLPLYQWVSSGERLVSFTAYFSCDVDLLAAGEAGARDLLRRLRALGNEDWRSVDIRSAVAWLRRFLLPTYGGANDTGGELTFAPRKLRLSVPGSGIGVAGGVASSGGAVIDPDSVTCVMTQCDVTYEGFFPSGLPRLASVALAFAQVAQLAGQVFFPHRTEEMENAVDGQAAGFFGYRVLRRPR